MNELMLVIIGRPATLFNSPMGEKVVKDGFFSRKVTDPVVDKLTPGFDHLLGETTSDIVKNLTEIMLGSEGV